MFDCCQETASIKSSHQYVDLETILNSLPHQPPIDPKSAPKMCISLDLPSYAEYLPTYWPGQNITGQVKIHLVNNIKVSHLRIALFGNVQVYGNHPGHAMANGLFDYRQNEQLINTGLRIIGGSVHNSNDHVTPTLTLDQDNTTKDILRDERRWRLHCRRDQRGTDDMSNKKIVPNKKTPEDRHIERLIRRVAAIDHTTNVCSGILNDPVCNNYKDEESSAFELNANSTTRNTIAFSIRVPTSRRLSGTFDHPHYPISYRIVAIMKCQDKDGNEMTCYSTVRLRLEPFMNIHASKYKSRIQSDPVLHYVHKNNGLLSGVCTSILSSSTILTHWLQEMTLKRISPSTYCSSYLQSHLELPKQAFERSQYIPLELKILNHAATHFKISAIKIHVEFIQHINMTCSMNEEVEGRTIQSATVVFKSSEEEIGDDIVFFKHANMTFDLSKLIQVPDDCTCTISCESTKNVFALGYDLDVKLDVTGITQRNDPILQEPHSYCANNKNFLKQEDALSLPKEPYHHKFKTYTLHLEPIPVIVGNSGYNTLIE